MRTRNTAPLRYVRRGSGYAVPWDEAMLIDGWLGKMFRGCEVFVGLDMVRVA